jgi:cytochrome c oxidase subunit 2
MAQQGEKLFEQLGCATCHQLDQQQGRCPNLRGVYGSRVQLSDGKTVVADDAYIRESILNPNAKTVAGYKPDVMPTFQGQITEEQLLRLIVYIKSLAGPGAPTAQNASPAAKSSNAVANAASRTANAGGKL